MGYSLPYLFLYLTFAILSVIYARCRCLVNGESLCKKITVVSFIIFFFFFAFRGYVYTDWISYNKQYGSATWGDIFDIKVDDYGHITEPGFTFLMCLCKLFSDQFATLVIAITTIDCFLLLKFFKCWGINNAPLFMMLFIIFSGISLMFNLLRNQLAILIFMNLLEYIEYKKPLKYFGGCAIALCIHVSSVFFFPLYFILGRKMNKYFLLVFFIFLIGCYLFHIPLLGFFLEKITSAGDFFALKIATYTELYSDARGFSVMELLMMLGLVVLVFSFYDNLTENHRNIILINCMMLYFLFYYSLYEFDMLSIRLSMLFIFSLWLLWIKIIELPSLGKIRKLIYGMLLICGLYSQVHAYPEEVQQYDNILFGARSMEERFIIRYKTFDVR